MPLFAHVPCQLPRATPCPIAFVGEAPGDTEICRGEPLVGPSGRLFNKMLALADIDRADCWVGNVFDEKIPGNDLKNWCQKEPTGIKFPGAGYLREEYHWHLARLATELSDVAPAVIVPLGGSALWAFTGHTDITRSRGAPALASRILPMATILPTFHPAYVMHSYGALGTVVADFRRAAELARGEEELTPRELWLEPSLGDMWWHFERYLRASELIAVDIETAAGQITEIGFAADMTRAICIPFVDYRKPSRSYWPDAESELLAWKWVRDILQLPNPKLFQNGPYDVFYLLRAGLPVRNWREDTRLQQHARCPEEPKSLAFMASRWAKQGAWKMMVRHTEEKRDDA